MNSLQTLIAGYAALILVVFIIILLLVLFITVCNWIIYEKAGQPGWAAIIPLYSTIIRLKIAGKPISWVAWTIQYIFFAVVNAIDRGGVITGVLYFFSLVAFFVINVITLNGLSKSFGKDAGFTVGLLFLPFIFFPMLAFGSAKYIGPGGISTSIPNQVL